MVTHSRRTHRGRRSRCSRRSYRGAPLTGLKVRGHPTRTRLLDAARQSPDGIPRREAHALLKDVPLRTRNYTIRLLLREGLLRETAGPNDEPRLLCAFPGQLSVQSP